MSIVTYEQLLTEALPQVIDTEEQNAQIAAQLSGLIRKGRARSAGETRLMRLLALLVEDYDRRQGLPSGDASPAEALQFLLDHSGKTAAVLLPIFGQRSHAHEAMTGKRPISAPQARKLGKLFSVQPGLFL
jgi:antitoxin component HigA of HigAB toxin-antitoxin module